MVRDRQTDISEGRGGETVGADCCVVLPRLCFLQEILGWPRGEGLKCAEHAVPTGAGSSRGCGAEDQGIEPGLPLWPSGVSEPEAGGTSRFESRRRASPTASAPALSPRTHCPGADRPLHRKSEKARAPG